MCLALDLYFSGWVWLSGAHTSQYVLGREFYPRYCKKQTNQKKPLKTKFDSSGFWGNSFSSCPSLSGAISLEPSGDGYLKRRHVERGFGFFFLWVQPRVLMQVLG